jgi:polyisoprenyl-teichoic acid--peptidoglycan teichoic acid transferase
MPDNDDAYPQPAPPGSRRRRPAGTGRPVRFVPGARRRWPRRLLVGVNIFIALCLIGTASVLGYVKWRFGEINTETIRGLRGNGDTPASAPFTLLVVGSDSRALTGANNAQFGTEAQTPGQRSDTILLVRVLPAARQLSILSIPRDLWVPIQGMGTQRINAAFNNGASLLVSTIKDDLGIPIDHYVEVNFDTFRQITDAVGGVKFWFPTPAKDAYSLLNVPQAGCVLLTGNQALAFVRSRHYEYYANGQWNYEAESDLARIQRQQAFIKKMIKKAETEYSNPIALNGIIGGVTKNLTVDQGFTTGFMLGLAKQLRTVDAASIPSETLPTFNETIGGAEVLGLQQPQASQMIAAFNALGTTPAPSVTPGSSSSPGTTIAPSSISIEVANGSGVTGQAAQAVSELTAAGYNATVDTTPGYGFTTNVIRYAPDSLAAATQLQARLAGGATLQEDSSLTPTNFNLELITGSAFNGLVSGAVSTSAAISATPTSGAATAGTAGAGSAPAGTSGTTTPAAGLMTLASLSLSGATSTAAPSTPPVTQYTLPGTPPGQVPPTTCN